MTLGAAIGNIANLASNFDFGFNSSRSGTDEGASYRLMQYQNDFWRGNTKWLNEEGWKQMRQGLINADYNPILAIGSSPMSGAMPSATADSSYSAGIDWRGSSMKQANTAKELSGSQIMLNKATANKITEEAITQQNIRQNYDADTALKALQSSEIQRLLPYRERKLIAETLALYSTVNLNNATAQFVPYNAESGRITSLANQKNADVNEQWAPSKLLLPALTALGGVGGLGLLSKGKNLFKGYKTANQIKKYKKLNSSSSYYKDFAGTQIH